VTGVVMVTGASGALGRQVVEFLLERLPPDRVAALARRPESLDAWRGAGCPSVAATTTIRNGSNRPFTG